MKATTIAAIAALATTSLAAHADDTWRFRLSGSGIVVSAGAQGCVPDDPNATLCPTDVTWTGTLSITTTGNADGTYTGADITDVDLATNFLSFQTDGFDTGSVFPAPLVLEIDDGRVAGIDILFADPPFSIFQAGLASASWSVEPGDHSGSIELSGTLEALPEPGAAALCVLGLAAVGAAGVRRRRDRTPRRAMPTP